MCFLPNGMKAEELNTEMAVHFCILETAGKQSPKNANVHEKLNVRGTSSGDLQSSFACDAARESEVYEEIATT